MNDNILKAVSVFFSGPTGGLRFGMVALGVLSLCDALILNNYSVTRKLNDNKDITFQPASDGMPKKVESTDNTSV